MMEGGGTGREEGGGLLVPGGSKRWKKGLSTPQAPAGMMDDGGRKSAECSGRTDRETGVKLEKEGESRQSKTEGGHDRKSGHLQDRDSVTSRPFIKEESRFHSRWVGRGRSVDPSGIGPHTVVAVADLVTQQQQHAPHRGSERARHPRGLWPSHSTYRFQRFWVDL